MVTNDPTSVQSYKGIELTVNKRFQNRWQMLAGYTFSHETWSDFTIPNLTTPNPNSALGMNGPVTGQLGDRPQQFKLTGTYMLPYDIALSGNFRSQSGIAVTRQVSTRPTVGSTFNVNVGPVGGYRLDPVTSLDLRLAKTLKLSDRRDLEGSVDFYNVTNSNVVWDVRTLSGTIGLRQAGDPKGTLNTVPQFLSPASVLAPRIIRFNVAFRF
jgi:hypothetical protein